MKMRGWLIASALAMLAACGGEAPTAPVATPSNTAASPVANVPVTGPERRIVAFGDSLFASYGLNKDQGFPARLQAALRAKGINAAVTDAGVSGDTTAAGRQRIAFVLDAEPVKPDLAIVELGGNDMLRQIAPTETRANLIAILDELQKREIPVLLMGMRAPPNLGADFVGEFDGIYPALARQYGAALVPFFMEPVYDQPGLMQQDRIHPTAEGIEAIVAHTADDVAAALPTD
jgi:acyl-CoA thioesterase-1